jgi:hypothetical protein
MSHYLSNLTIFAVARINPTDEIWQLSVGDEFAGVLYNKPSTGFWAKTIRTIYGETRSSLAYGVTVEECLIVAKNDYFGMADWDCPLDPVDEEAEIDRERHAN